MDENKRTLKVNLEDLKAAFDLGYDELNQFLDLETGAIVQVSDDTTRHLEMLVEINDSETINAAIQHEEIADWEKELLHDAARVLLDKHDRFLGLPHPDIRSREGYKAMHAFIETVTDKHLRELLLVATRGKGAFGRFDGVLIAHPQERQRWFQFKDKQLRQRVITWLEANNITPIA